MEKNNQYPIPYFEVLDPFQLVYRKSSTKTPVGPHTHNAMEIYFTLSDLPDVFINNTISNVAKGSLIIIPPYSVHQLFNQKDLTYERYIITINNQWLHNSIPVKTTVSDFAVQTSEPLIMTLSFSEQSALLGALNAFLQKDPSAPLSYYAVFFEIMNLLDKMIKDFLDNNAQYRLSINDSQENINQIIAYINAHLSEPISLNEIASHLYMNKDYLSRLFKKYTHITIGDFIAIQKVNLARSLLSSGASISESQEKTGFSSYAYFFRFFKKMTGFSPSHYRA